MNKNKEFCPRCQTEHLPEEHPCAHEPRPFKVGDRVERTAYRSHNVPLGTLGNITRIWPSWAVSVDWDGIGVMVCVNADKCLRLIEPAPEPKPRPFQVGDRVSGKTGETGPVCEGIVFRIDDAGDVHFTTDQGTRRWAHPSNLELVSARWMPSPGPLDPQAEKLLEEARESLAEAKRKQDHTDALLVKALDERDAALREARAHASTVDNLQARLADVAAILRCIELAKASPVEEWDHVTLLADVVRRGEA